MLKLERAACVSLMATLVQQVLQEFGPPCEPLDASGSPSLLDAFQYMRDCEPPPLLLISLRGPLRNSTRNSPIFPHLQTVSARRFRDGMSNGPHSVQSSSGTL